MGKEDVVCVCICIYNGILLSHLEKEMATQSSILAWKIPWTKEPGGLQSMGSQRVGHAWVTNTHSVISSVQSLSCVRLFATPWIAARQASLSITNSPEFTQTHVHRVSDAIQPSHPLSSPSPPAPHPSQHQSLFQWVNSSHEVAKVLEFQL